jgi:hypothetical protein
MAPIPSMAMAGAIPALMGQMAKAVWGAEIPPRQQAAPLNIGLLAKPAQLAYLRAHWKPTTTPPNPPNPPTPPGTPKPPQGPGNNGGNNGNNGGSGGKTYQTYTVTNNQTGLVYSGRTGGFDTPYNNIRRRFRAGHPYSGGGWGSPVLDKSSTNPSSIRGREQMLINYFQGIGIGVDQIGGISPRNPNFAAYMQAALDEFGQILTDPRFPGP